VPNELFRTVAGRRSSAGHRLGAVPLSVALHAAILVAVVVIPLIATDVLPVPRIPLVLDLPTMPAVVVPSVPVPRAARPVIVSPDSLRAPVVAPSGIGPGTGVEPTPVAISDVSLSELTAMTNVSQLISDSEIVAPPPPLKPAGPVKVGGDILPPRKIHNQMPVYPPIALAAHVEGTVVIDAVISTTGAVQEARVVTSVPLLDEAALAAVRQWVFTPTLLNGVPVPVIMTVKVEFKLR
jgi:protein TonB